MNWDSFCKKMWVPWLGTYTFRRLKTKTYCLIVHNVQVFLITPYSTSFEISDAVLFSANLEKLSGYQRYQQTFPTCEVSDKLYIMKENWARNLCKKSKENAGSWTITDCTITRSIIFHRIDYVLSRKRNWFVKIY